MNQKTGYRPSDGSFINPGTAPAGDRGGQGGWCGLWGAWDCGRWAALPARGQGHSLGVAGGALQADNRALVQLVPVAGASVGAGAAQPGGDRVDQVLDAGTLRVQV